MDLNWTVTQSDLHMKKTTLSSGAENETKAVNRRGSYGGGLDKGYGFV